jgi:hypothetical protein
MEKYKGSIYLYLKVPLTKGDLGGSRLEVKMENLEG